MYISIGDRQLGRLQATSVINYEPIEKEIRRAIDKQYSLDFMLNLAVTKSPYGERGASARAVMALKETSLNGIVKKRSMTYNFPMTLDPEK